MAAMAAKDERQPLTGSPRRRGASTRRPPRVGEHNAELLGELGYSQEELEALAASGAV